MSIFGNLFKGFSTRSEAAAKRKHTVPERTRTRILMLCEEIFSNQQTGPFLVGHGDYVHEFWEEIHRLLRYRHGRMQFHEQARSAEEDAIQFVMTCPGEELLDFVEYIFQVNTWSRVGYSPDQMIEDVNGLFRQEDLPYSLTGFVRETARQTIPELGSRERDVTRTVSYPQIIMRENESTHAQAIRPALELLQQPEYSSANAEYLSALEDYRKNDFADCLTKCGSAFESVLKIICHRKGWPYKQTDTAAPLIKTFLAHTQLESYFEAMLMTTATLRNRMSASHGAGAQTKQVPRHVALYALNVTASAILLLTQEAE